METHHPNEFQRLENQASLFSMMHSKALDLASVRLPDASLLLDIGCGNGAPLRDLNFRRIIGIDHNPKALEIARRHLRPPRYKFLEMDVESEQFIRFLKHDLPRKPLLARLSFSLHHLDDPVRILHTLKEHLPERSVVLAISPDQEMSCAYPGENYEALLEHSRTFPERLADARHGRKLGDQMREAGLSDVTIAPYFFSTTGVRDAYKRQLLFSVFNEFRIQKWERALQDGMPGAEKGLRKTEALLEQLRRQFQDPNFFFMSTMMIGVGRV